MFFDRTIFLFSRGNEWRLVGCVDLEHVKPFSRLEGVHLRRPVIGADGHVTGFFLFFFLLNGLNFVTRGSASVSLSLFFRTREISLFEQEFLEFFLLIFWYLNSNKDPTIVCAMISIVEEANIPVRRHAG